MRREMEIKHKKELFEMKTEMKVEHAKSAIQTIKYGIRVSSKSALELFGRKDPKRDPVDNRLCRIIQTSRKRYAEEQEVNRAAVEQKRKCLAVSKPTESKLQAKKRMYLAQKAARKAHKLQRELRLQRLAKLKKHKSKTARESKS